MRRSFALATILVAACAPSHLRPLGNSGDREVALLFSGGWDGRRLSAYDDTAVEPGVTPAPTVARIVRKLSGSEARVVWLEKDKTDDTFKEGHGAFCETPFCIAVFAPSATDLNGVGELLALFEIQGPVDGPIGQVWLSSKAVRPPGPRKWELLCKSSKEPPRYVHPDGGAIFPARPGFGDEGFALFGPTAEPKKYKAGFAAPDATTCDAEELKIRNEGEPERPVIKPGLDIGK